MNATRLQQLATNNEGFCFDPGTGETYQLNESAQVLLSALRSGSSEKEAARILAETFTITASEAQSDTNEFLQMLRIYGVTK